MLQWNPWKRVWGGWSLKSVQTQTILLFCVNGSESSCGSQWIKAWSHLWDNLCPVGLDLTITPHSQRLGEDGAGVWWSSSNVTSHPLRASRTSSDAFRALDMGLHKFPSIKNKSRWMVLVSRKKKWQWRKAMTRTKINNYLSRQAWKCSMEVWLFCKGIPKLIPDVSERVTERTCMFYFFFFLSSFHFNDQGKWEECKWVNALFDLCCSWA